MAFNTNKNIGNSRLGMAIAYFTNHNYTVSIPLNDTQDYDLIVEKNGILSKIQVKGTSFKTKYDVFQVALKSSGGSKGKIYKTVIDTNIDYLFVVTKDLKMYLIPKNMLSNKYTLNLNNYFNKYLVELWQEKFL